MASGEICVKMETDSLENDVKPALSSLCQPADDNQSSLDAMTSSYVSVAPSSLARSPVSWSPLEVKAWLEFCVKQFAINPVCVDKFNMNGKALLLLTRTDFMERVPHAGDLLYNAFHILQKQHKILQGSPLQPQSVGHSYVSFHLQGPGNVSDSCSTNSSLNTSSRSNIPSSDDGEKHSSASAGIHSSALTENHQPDADSSENESRLHTSDQEMDSEELQNSDIKYDLTAINDDGASRLLWEFIYQLLQDVKWSQVVCWESADNFTFRIMNPTNLADAWGKQKNRSNMTYEKLSRALRYYYKMNIIKKVSGKRLTYQFLQDPAKIRKGQRGARPHTSRSVETSTPDSSTFPVTSPKPSSPGTFRQLSDDLSCSEDNQEQHHPSCESTGSLISGCSDRFKISLPHFVSSSQDFKVTAHLQSPLQSTGQDVFSAENKAVRPSSLSPNHQFQVLPPKESRFSDSDNCCMKEKSTNSRCESSCYNSEAYISSSQRRSPGLYQTAEEVKDKKSSLLLQSHGQTASNIPMTGGYYCFDKNQSCSSVMDDQSTLQIQNIHNSPQLRITQDCTRRTNFQQTSSILHPSVPVMPPRNLTSSVSEAEKSCNTFYQPYPRQSKHYTHSHSSHCGYFPENQHPYQSSIDYSKRNTEKHSNPLSVGHQYAINTADASHDYASASVKEEMNEQEQKEPEDLSMKKHHSRDFIYIASDFNLSQGSHVKDTPRDSPQSCSSDSAYGSDRADFGKDSPVENLHKEMQ